RPRLEKLAAQEAGDRIIFLGQVKRDQLYKYYSAADIFAYPGINEALGMVYLEAQCTGLPVVAYSTRGPKEAVVHGQTGLLSPEKTSQPLKIAFIRHSVTEWNEEGRIQGHFNSPLTEHGRELAAGWRKNLEPHTFDAVLTSDLGRTIETA
ncbi:Histidine phosphatase superfamily, clade-1 like protein, partial [Aduncisulcus paluster]